MRIVFASLGSLGDLNPLLALASESRDRGHTAVVAAAGVYTQYVTSLGFEFYPLRPDFGSDTLIELIIHPREGAERMMTETIFPHVRDTYQDLLVAAQAADFIVAGELVYAARLVAAVQKIPWANAILSPQSFLSVQDPSLLAPLPEIYPLRHLGTWPYRLIFKKAQKKTMIWAAPLLALQRELGLAVDTDTLFVGKYSPHLVLAMFPALLAAPQTDWPAAALQTGFPFFAQPANPETLKKIADFLAAGDPPLVFTLGSTVVHLAKDFYQIAAEAARILGRRAILLIGNNPHPAAPADQILCIDYAPLDATFPHAAVVIHHGGVGSCGEVLRAGVPALIIPFGFDQPDNAARLHRAQLCRVLPRKRISLQGLVSNLKALLADTAMQARAKEVARKIDPAGDIARSVAAIEQAAAKYSSGLV